MVPLLFSLTIIFTLIVSKEQEFKILPHPANDNVSNTAPTETTPGLGSAPNLDHLPKGPAGQDATQAKGSYVPSKDLVDGLEKPKTREELQSLQAQLND